MLDRSHILFGVTVPLVTVLDDDGRPDASGADRLLAAMAEAGVHSLMLLGSNGEGALLPADRTAGYLTELIARWRELRPEGRAIVNVSAPGTTEMLHRAETALAAAPDTLVVSPPGYFHHRADEIEHHLRAVEGFGHPWAVYNVPKYANDLAPEVFEALLDAPNLVGMKDSSGSLAALEAFVGVAAARPGIAVSQGDERALVAGLRAGAIGIVPGIGNLAPGLSTRLLDAELAGDAAEADRAQAAATAITGIHAVRPGVPTVKAVLHDRGLLDSERCAPPLAAVTAAELDGVRAVLAPLEDELIGGRRA